MIAIAAALGGIGLVCMIYRRTLLGVLIGLQLLGLGAAMIFVLAGVSSGEPVQGHVCGLFITLSGVAQLVTGLALAIRLFYLKKRASMDDLRTLRQ